jgi:uncharacterized protein (TIGR02594 family)
MTTSDKWKAIQSAVGATADGIPGRRTAEAVAAKLGLSWKVKPAGDQESALDAPKPEPSWMKRARSHVGEAEIKGPRHNSKIVGWWDDIKASFRDDETPWCAGFVGAMLEQSGYKSTRSAAARSYMNWGRALSKPRQGCVVVFWRGSKSGWSGHVGFLAGIGSDGSLYVLGGNQSDQVSVAKFSQSRLLGYRWPEPGPEVLKYPVRRLDRAGRFSTNEA